jgi:hypothetical protein
MFMSSDHIISDGRFCLEVHNAVQALCTLDRFLIHVTASISSNPYSGSKQFQDFISCDEVPRHMLMFFVFMFSCSLSTGMFRKITAATTATVLFYDIMIIRRRNSRARRVVWQ